MVCSAKGSPLGTNPLEGLSRWWSQRFPSLPDLPAESPSPQGLVSENVLEAWLACLAESSVLITFCPRRLCASRPQGQGWAMQRLRALSVSKDEMGAAACTTGSPPGGLLSFF